MLITSPKCFLAWAIKTSLLGALLSSSLVAMAQTPPAPAASAATEPPVLVPVNAQQAALDAAIAEVNELLSHPVLGEFDCQAKVSVLVAKDPRIPGRFHVNLGKKRYHMHPVSTSTGVIRLEDSAEGVVWLQLGNKSMMMNARLGRRMADDCTSEPQRRLVQLLKDKPKEDLLK
jgi:hypothetical protein